MASSKEKIPPFMSQQDYARYRGISHVAVIKAIKMGRITSIERRGRSILIDVAKADKEWNDNTFVGNQRTKEGDTVIAHTVSKEGHPGKDGADNVSSGPSYANSRARREELQASMLEMEFELKSGRLVRLDEVERKAFDDGRRVKSAVMALPDRLHTILAAESDPAKVHAMLSKECAGLLRGLARELRESE